MGLTAHYRFQRKAVAGDGERLAGVDCAAELTIRRPPQLGRKPRRLQKNATSSSLRHPEHYRWARWRSGQSGFYFRLFYPDPISVACVTTRALLISDSQHIATLIPQISQNPPHPLVPIFLRHRGRSAIMAAKEGEEVEMRERPKVSAAQLIQQLGGAQADSAWSHFLAEYTDLVDGVVHRYVTDEDDADDCYLSVCEKLAENGYSRLRRFDPSGTASFSTWLRVVVTNLCIDWSRQQMGRVRPFANIDRLPELARRVYHYRYEQHLTLHESIRALQGELSGVSEADVIEALHQVNATLTPHQRWVLSVRNGKRLTPVDSGEVAIDGNIDETVEAQRQAERLNRALSSLEARDRLLLKLRFEEDLSFREIATLMRFGNLFRARREIQAALGRLRALLGDENLPDPRNIS